MSRRASAEHARPSAEKASKPSSGAASSASVGPSIPDDVASSIWIVMCWGNGEIVCLDRRRRPIKEARVTDRRAAGAFLESLRGRLAPDVQLRMQDYGAWPLLTEGRLAYIQRREPVGPREAPASLS